jgi:hypothetical protein
VRAVPRFSHLAGNAVGAPPSRLNGPIRPPRRSPAPLRVNHTISESEDRGQKTEDSRFQRTEDGRQRTVSYRRFAPQYDCLRSSVLCPLDCRVATLLAMTGFFPSWRGEYFCCRTGAAMNQTPATTLDPQTSVIARAEGPWQSRRSWRYSGVPGKLNRRLDCRDATLLAMTGFSRLGVANTFVVERAR